MTDTPGPDPDSPPIRIVIADDHSMFRQGIARLFAGVDDMEIVADCDNGDDLVRLIAEHRPDVALVDISMPGPGPAGIVAQVDAMESGCSLVALTMHLEPSLAGELLAHGMSGYVIKDAAFEDVLDAVRAVREGDQYLSRELLAGAPDATGLTERELDCLRRAAGGDTAKQIARDLDITERTVRFHLANVYRKLGVQRRSQAVAVAYERRIL